MPFPTSLRLHSPHPSMSRSAFRPSRGVLYLSEGISSSPAAHPLWVRHPSNAGDHRGCAPLHPLWCPAFDRRVHVYVPARPRLGALRKTKKGHQGLRSLSLAFHWAQSCLPFCLSTAWLQNPASPTLNPKHSKHV